MEGWIKIHRQIREHWIWDDPMYLKAWIGILISVNHEDRKVLIEGELIECNRGQSLLSLTGWSKLFGKKWTIQRVRTFFELLKRDQMIITEGLRKTTRVTVCKYDEYQIEQQTKNKQRTKRQQPDNNQITTNKNEKNEKKEIMIKKENAFKLQVSIYSNGYPQEMLEKFVNYWTEKNNSGTKMKFELEKTFEISKRLSYWASRDKSFDVKKPKNEYHASDY